ncbi:hypothetical protein PQX77_012735 [Marasmius sp. AFHP31]|nr:hypothetical protein PQX77_012735 [Marasmius sp. AFHP31]
MSTYFPDCRKLRINDGNFSHVGGDQHNHYNQIVQQKEKERTKYDDFRNVRQGDFSRLKDIGIIRYRQCQCMLGRHRCWFCKLLEKWKANRTICSAEVDGSPGQVYTAVSYSGPDARKAFEADFQTYSQVLSSQVAQIYAIDIGTVPSLLFRNELVPLAHFEEHLSSFIRLYLDILLRQWDCSGEEVWIDSARGIICRGPAGPYTGVWIWREVVGLGDTPSTVDFLQEDVVLRFFASRKSREVDGMFIGWMMEQPPPYYVPGLVNPNAVEVISTLSNTPIAIAACHDQTWDNFHNLLERTLLENGLCRFRLRNGRWFKLEWGLGAARAWLSQAWSVFHALGITVEDDLEAFVFIFPSIMLSGSPSQLKAKRQRRLQQPIYLFVRPLPRGYIAPNDKRWFQYQTSSLHYWSFRKDGDSPLSHETCHYLGLPTVLRLNCYFLSSSWTAHVYKTIHEYQLLQGFDPRTTDFARNIGLYNPIFQPANDSVHFKELSEERITGSPEPYIDSDPEDVYDELDDYSLALTELFYTGSDDDTYTNPAHILNIQDRKDHHEDFLSSSNARAQNVAVPPESELTTSKDSVVNERTGAEYEGEFKGTKRREQHLDQALLEQCTALSTLTAERPSLPSISETDPFPDSTSPNVAVLPTSSFPTPLILTYIIPTTMSNTDAPTNAGWSATSHSTNNNNPCNALAGASNITSAVSHPPGSTVHKPVYSTSTVEYAIADASLTRPPVSVAQQQWIPRPFISNIKPVAHRSSWPALATSGSPTRNEDDRCNGDGNEELD